MRDSCTALADNGGEHSFEIERRVHRLATLAERAQLLDRAAKFIGALAQFVKQPRILDGDNGLGGEGRDQLDLLVGEGTNFLAIHDERTDQFVLLQHWNSQNRPHAPKFDGCNASPDRASM